MNRVDRIVLDPIRTYAFTRTARTDVRVTGAVVTLESKEKGSLKAKRSWLVRVKAEGTLVTSAKQHKLASD